MSHDPAPGTDHPGRDHRPSAALANLVPLAYLVAEAVHDAGRLDPVRVLVLTAAWFLVAHAVRIAVEHWPARSTGRWTAHDPADVTLPVLIGDFPFFP